MRGHARPHGAKRGRGSPCEVMRGHAVTGGDMRGRVGPWEVAWGDMLCRASPAREPSCRARRPAAAALVHVASTEILRFATAYVVGPKSENLNAPTLLLS